MRTSLVIPAIVATALAAVHGCSLPLEGLPPDGNGGAAATSVTSAGGASTSITTTTSTTVTSSATGTGGSSACSMDAECSGGTTCKTPKCTNGACGFETASHDAAVCAPPSGPCFDESQCAGGECAPRPKPGSTTVDDGAPGNCTKLFCDGTGKSTPVADPADPPADPDSTDCSVPSCTGTSPASTLKDDGASCGQGWHCLAGQCRECASDPDCPGDLNLCTDTFCNNGTCDQKPVAAGSSCVVGTCFGSNCCVFSQICSGQCCSFTEHCSGNMCKPNL